MLLKEALGRSQEVLDLGDPYATVNWMVHEVCTAVANGLWHSHVAKKITSAPKITDAQTASAAAAILNELCDHVSFLVPDEGNHARQYIRNLEHELVVATMDLEVYHFDVWEDLSEAVSGVKLLASLMAEYLPENMRNRRMP